MNPNVEVLDRLIAAQSDVHALDHSTPLGRRKEKRPKVDLRQASALLSRFIWPEEDHSRLCHLHGPTPEKSQPSVERRHSQARPEIAIVMGSAKSWCSRPKYSEWVDHYAQYYAHPLHPPTTTGYDAPRANPPQQLENKIQSQLRAIQRNHSSFPKSWFGTRRQVVRIHSLRPFLISASADPDTASSPSQPLESRWSPRTDCRGCARRNPGDSPRPDRTRSAARLPSRSAWRTPLPG